MPASDPLEGQVLHGTYRILRALSRGGMGVVYEAENIRLPDVRFAVKVLLPLEEAGDLLELFPRFQREAEILAGLRHPNIISILDFNRTGDGHPYLVMELLEGEDLSTRLKRGPLSVLETCTLMRQVGGALQYVHDAGVVHRDLKPANIFLALAPGGWQAKLLDFGISKEVGPGRALRGAETGEMAVIGTTAYMAPEQARGQSAEVDHRADVFALASVAYRCLTGRRPFGGETPREVLSMVCNEEPASLLSLKVGLPEGLDQVLRRAHAKEREQRYARVTDFVSDLLAACGRSTVVPLLHPLDTARTEPVLRVRPSTVLPGSSAVAPATGPDERPEWAATAWLRPGRAGPETAPPAAGHGGAISAAIAALLPAPPEGQDHATERRAVGADEAPASMAPPATREPAAEPEVGQALSAAVAALLPDPSAEVSEGSRAEETRAAPSVAVADRGSFRRLHLTLLGASVATVVVAVTLLLLDRGVIGGRARPPAADAGPVLRQGALLDARVPDRWRATTDVQARATSDALVRATSVDSLRATDPDSRLAPPRAPVKAARPPRPAPKRDRKTPPAKKKGLLIFDDI